MVLHCAACMDATHYPAVAKQAKQIKLTKAAKQWHQALESRAWRSWQDAAAQAKARRKIAARWMQPAKVWPRLHAAAAAASIALQGVGGSNPAKHDVAAVQIV